MKIRFLEKKNDIGLLILRLSVGVMMLLHGISKLFNGLGGIQSILASNNMPEFLSYGFWRISSNSDTILILKKWFNESSEINIS